MKYTINGIPFKSQEAVRDHCREIRDRITGTDIYDVDYGVVYCLDGADRDFMIDFIKHLHDADNLIGCGIREILICVVPKGKFHWGFCVLRVDASEQIFGFGKFGASPQQVRERRASEAFRNAISDQTIEYKEQYFDGHLEAPCEATGELMTRVDCHVDHEEPTFRELVRQFFGENPNIEMVDDGLCWHIADKDLRHAWQEFHRKHAKLRCTTRNFNLTRKESPVHDDTSPRVLHTEQPKAYRNPGWFQEANGDWLAGQQQDARTSPSDSRGLPNSL